MDEIEFIKNIDKNIFNEIFLLEYRGSIGKINNLKICVYNREGDNIPHFHINRIGFPSTCLNILEASFFKHGKNTGELYKDDLKKIYNWLTKDNNKHWKEIIIEWNKHVENKLNINLPVPLYYKINKTS